ncbi:MAG: type IV toxin-antitoxin system AbiEi family antitoxin domain-containing protein [Salinibacterium sp.]|nr:type IV toxin-antitoxin system AbiEi family antitoxin domain-containing protein [Salinibacterium sp.]
MGWFDKLLARHGGVFFTDEAYRRGDTQSMLYWSVARGSIIRARRGVYCDPRLSDAALLALRVGGRLACVSALAHHGLTAAPSEVHIVVPANASRLRKPKSSVVIHWTRRELGGDRIAVDENAARRQAARCRAVVRDTL